MPRTHGARSVELVRHKRDFQRRRIVTALRLEPGSLSPIALAYIENLAKVRVQILLVERYLSKHRPEVYDSDGSPPPCMPFYLGLLNSERNAITRLAQHLPTEVEVDALYEQFRPDKWRPEAES